LKAHGLPNPEGHPEFGNESMNRSLLVQQLLKSPEPSIRWKTRVNILGEDQGSKRCVALRHQVARSPRVRALLARRDPRGRIVTPKGVYDKWQGAHWVLASLADLGYPEGDRSLVPVRDQVYDCWLSPRVTEEFEARAKSDAYKRYGVPVMNGRARRCASQQGNALWFLHTLGVADERSDQLSEHLVHWQWPDGGWNCDKDPTASTSSFTESLLPMIGLAAHANATQDRSARAACARTAEFFLNRGLFRRRSGGRPIHPEFTFLHYPLYWHYDILVGLRAMMRLGRVRESRCSEALDVLEQKELSDGGWPSEKRYYTVHPEKISLNADYVDWGPTGKTRMNEWVTTDALSVLIASGRASL
jgi:hypothetical protein